ncbi:MAG: leucine-rich repeat protein, partial [Prevotellaceae bacterium]|nr:leucine-rich repeat protein [Prevotellaceae bacterium]
MKPKIVRNSVLRWPLAVGLIAAAMVACEKEDEAANTGGESKSAAADITAFGTGSVTWNISGATIAYTYPPETDPLAPLTPTITISKGATITPASGVAQNFFTEAGVTYTVTSEDGTTTKTYVAKATRTPHNGNSITSFIVDDVAWNIDGQLITHTCPPETDTQAPLTPTITISTGATIDPPAGTAQSGFFSATGVQYTVTPEEGAPRVYFAKATRAPYSASSITAFSVNVNGIATAASWTISGTNISYIFPPEAGVTADATFAPNIALSPGATIDPPASEAQNFFPAAGVQYTVTAEDGESTTVYTVKASIQAAGGTTGACSWTLSGYPGTGTYTLTISGTGAMANYGMNGTPWNDYKANINTVVIENGVTAIGNWAFYGCKMTTVEVPESVTAIGE